MKLHLDRFDGRNAFTGMGDGYVAVNGQMHRSSLVVFPDRIIDPWPVPTIEALDATALQCLVDESLEIVLVGTGARHRFPHPSAYASLARKRIGVEIMQTDAACRTYNILLAEGRRVAAALIVEPRA